jgi:hypothetical protein
MQNKRKNRTYNNVNSPKNAINVLFMFNSDDLQFFILKIYLR